MRAMVTEEARPSPSTRGLRCPTCGRETIWKDNPHRPFCSLSCRLVDLGVWLDEGYRLPAEEPLEEGPPDAPRAPDVP